jgi:hypothetical protein
MNRAPQMRILAVILFVALAFAGDRLLSIGAASIVKASQFRLSRIYRGDVDADIVIIGNSRAVHSVFAPRLAEVTCNRTFNAGYNGLSALSMSAMLKDYLERNRKPKFALIEISATAVWDRSGAELKTYAPLSERLTRFFEVGNSRYRIWSRLTHLYHFNTELFLRCLFYLHRPDQDWIIEDRQISDSVIREYAGLERNALDESERRTTALRNMAVAARSAGVQPIFYVAPYHPVAFDRTPELKTWLDKQRGLLEADAPLIELSRAVSADQAFADPIHLNKSGSYELITVLTQTPQGRALSSCDL